LILLYPPGVDVIVRKIGVNVVVSVLTVPVGVKLQIGMISFVPLIIISDFSLFVIMISVLDVENL
jgi:hypothetical protein